MTKHNDPEDSNTKPLTRGQKKKQEEQKKNQEDNNDILDVPSDPDSDEDDDSISGNTPPYTPTGYYADDDEDMDDDTKEDIDDEMDEGDEYVYLDENGYLRDGFVVSDDEDPDEDDLDESDSMKQIISPLELLFGINPKKNEKIDKLSKEDKKLYDQYDNIMDSYQPMSSEDYFLDLDTEAKKQIINQEQFISSQLRYDIPLRFQILNSSLPDSIKAIAIQKAITAESSRGGDAKLREWLDGLLRIPFGRYVTMPVNLASPPYQIKQYLQYSSNVLNEAVYGQQDTKNHIIRIISQLISNPNSIGNVFAIHGPMGTGKTSLVRRGIARALGRPFTLISLGGITDSSLFRGHSYTYEGSRPGRMVDILRDSQCMNPVIYFDELDKVSDTPKGEEIIHTLIHLTDKSQNMHFHDNYYTGVPIDISKAIFIFSYNNEEKINPILLDRMYKIRVDGFSLEEKIQIARYYLLRDIYGNFNFQPDMLLFSDETLAYIINNYTKNNYGTAEEGVRNLERCLEIIVSKINVSRLSQADNGYQQSFANVPEQPHLTDDEFYEFVPQNNQEYTMPFQLPDLQFPFEITIPIVHTLLNNPQTASYYMNTMYS